jgi:beta-mannosidase
MQKIDLNGTWQCKAINAYGALPNNKRDVTRWMDGTVPGTVHTDLIANRKIPDPFYRMNEHDVQWVDSQQWMYRREFTIPAALLKADAVHLVAEGLDTYAQINCNGRKVAETANMFVEHRFDVKKHLRAGRNTIEILFDSPTVRSKAFEKKHGALSLVEFSPHRVYVRKAQYSFGWDWGPILATSGIWRNIFIEAYSYARLCDPFVKILSVDKKEAIVELSVEVERFTKLPLTLRVVVAGGKFHKEEETAIRGHQVKVKVRIPRPLLWWPNGYGDQPLYTATFSLIHEEKVMHTLEVPFAIRTVRLLQEKDAEGKSFILEVNGEKIFCKGANWIPSDNFIPRFSDSKYQALLQMAKDANMNMLRIWGGGIYEQNIFYELCNKLGLMVWQDFMFACSGYPEQPWFLKEVKREAEKAVKKLRNHASIVLWCGNNECEWAFCNEFSRRTADDMPGITIFKDILPAICKQSDGTRPYWQSSPFGEGFPNAEDNGDHHEWSVWSGWKDYEEYEKCNGRFVSEFGFQAPANRRTYEEITLSEDRHPQSKVMEHHNKQVEGPERLFRFQAAHYNLSEGFDGFIYKGQLVQAEALKCAVEYWRRRMFNTAGALFWQLNDCWPVSSWSVVDSALRPKAAYYFAKRFFAPFLVSFKKIANDMEVWITSDALKTTTGKFTLTLRSFEGKIFWTQGRRITILPNQSKMAHRLAAFQEAKYDPATHYLHAQLWIEGERVSENRWFFEKPKHLRLPRPSISTTLRSIGESSFVLVLHAETFVKNVRLEIEGEDVVFGDNYFDIDAGESKEVSFISRLTADQLTQKLRLRCL